MGVKVVGHASDLRHQCQDVQRFGWSDIVAVMDQARNGAIWACVALTNNGRSARLKLTTETGELSIDLPIGMLQVSMLFYQAWSFGTLLQSWVAGRTQQ
jgi:hypothetical protein